MYHYELINPSQPASLHQVRIALRKFRYLLEMLEPLLPGMPASHLEHLRTYQTLLGEIQDGTLFADLSEGSNGPVPAVRDYYEQEMSRALNTYLPIKDQIRSFWRHGSQEYLPWGAEGILKGQRLMDIYIIRHAIAVEAGTPGYDDDSQRPLTGTGRKKMKKIARGIKSLGIGFDCVVSSPYVRARETAEILADELKLKKKLTFSDALVPPGDFDRLIHELAGMDGLESVALVGHEPMLSQFIGWLTTAGGGMSLELKKGGLAYLQAEDLPGSHRATLKWLLTPVAMIAING
jgi:phosphohistidine phosphatase